MSAPDCLICLQPQRIFWTPPTRCACAPRVHRNCWNAWTTQAGERCIICREPRLPPPNERPVMVIIQPVQIQEYDPCRYWTLVFCVATLMLMWILWHRP